MGSSLSSRPDGRGTVDAYVLLQTEPGLATIVMNSLVESGVVDRALAVTGEADVFARINNLEWNELTDRLLNRLQRVPGIVRSSTSIVVPTRAVVPGTAPAHPVFHELRGAGIYALVFVKIAAGSARDVVKSVRAMKSVLGLAVVTGDHDLIVQVHGRTIERLAATVLSDIQAIPGVTSTTTSLILAATPLRRPKPAARKRARRTRR
jgi:DNA-binding Lrp family transcriptional regulator